MRPASSYDADFESALWAALDRTGDARRAALLDLAVRYPQHERAVQLLLAEPDPGTRSAAVQLPARIGPYAVLSSLGEGGMGQVVLARQDAPVSRLVAVKVVKRGMDSARVLARFQLERQVLALMEHPCIATVFDAGVADSGQPYFAMEYVPGEPLTDYCDRHALPVHARLELFLAICAGVEHAHQRGVLHRDLKPSNILVGERDGRPVPKVIDFGLAKLLALDDAAPSEFTQPEQLVGTVEYMSPEQVDGGSRGLDTRSDVYALGVVLHQLLVGELPFERGRLRGADRGRVRQAIESENPKRPSTRITELGESARELARLRQLEPATLRRHLRNDLDWVVLKCLEKDRERRYGSARELADDLRRHRTAAVAVGLVLTTAVVGAVATWRQARQTASALERFQLLAYSMQLRDAEQEEATLYPALPEQVPAMRSWLERRAPLLQEQPRLLQTAAELRRRAVLEAPPVPGNAAAAEELRLLRAELASKQLQTDVACGRATFAEVDPPPPTASWSARQLDERLPVLLGPNMQNQVHGSEAEALALARRSLAKVVAGDPSLALSRAWFSLAQACFYCGLFDECERALAAGLDVAAPMHRASSAVSADNLRRHMQEVRSPTRQRYLGELRLRVESLARLGELDDLRFPDDGERFLYENLVRLLERLRTFGASTGPLAGVRARLADAEAVQARTVDAHRTAWDAAIAAIAAHPAYGGLRLPPQVGLVPIGADPESKLWEFVHLASGQGECAIPERDAAGRLLLSSAMGIVLVLVPGGDFHYGAQRHDAAAPNYDPDAMPVERTTPRSVAPFLVGKYEVTQGQWARLVRGTFQERYPSGMRIGRTYAGLPMPVSERFPVETIDQATAAQWLARAGLCLPSEVQWEYACRAGTDTPWYTGAELASLVGHANVLDQDGGRLVGTTECAPFTDGFGTPAPVGSYQGANGFGLFDVIGNVGEWTADRYASPQLALEGDPAGADRVARPLAILRGGKSNIAPAFCRSASRDVLGVRSYDGSSGCRAAMSLRR